MPGCSRRGPSWTGSVATSTADLPHWARSRTRSRRPGGTRPSTGSSSPVPAAWCRRWKPSRSPPRPSSGTTAPRRPATRRPPRTSRVPWPVWTGRWTRAEPAMADEYYARYAGLSHHDLYYQLRAGDPGQVENLASAWRSLAVSVDELAADLDRDLDGLRSSWTGSASDEFDHRVRLVSGFARELSEEFTRTQRSLSLMAGPLRGAQARAEHPDETDDHDKLLRGIAIGAVAGPGGALVGGLFGHQLDKEEKQ